MDRDESGVAAAALAPSIDKPGRVLSTLNADGSRRWLRPRLSKGRFWSARRIVAYLLIAVFTIVPHLSIGGVPVLRLDIAGRQFSFFGRTFLSSDTLLMALLMVTIFVAIFLVTALFGRVWCGWACPQTVYMEFLFRPLERLFDGAPEHRQKVVAARGLRKALKYVAFFICAVFLAHTFLAYFVGPDELLRWVRRSPFEHPGAFLIMAATTGLMLFDFCFFREQVCLVACPYGRFQSAMLDRHSLIITYDRKRGEPRGRKKRGAGAPSGDISLRVVPDVLRGDCIDCQMCVTTCPTGIDIRDGLQMECIGCAQCIDACDAVMDKVGRPRGLIRYSSQAVVSGDAKRIMRPRTIIYPGVLAALMTIFLLVLGGQQSAEAQILPRQGAPFYSLDATHEIANQVRVRIINRSRAAVSYTIVVPAGARLLTGIAEHILEPGESRILGFQIAAPPEAFDDHGVHRTTLTVTGSDGFEKSLRYGMLGPRQGGAR